MNDEEWYFAYGSNLLVARMEERTGPLREVHRARLAGYRFAFNKQRNHGQIYANIVPDDASEVWGVVYRCNAAALGKLDKAEGVSNGDYERMAVTVVLDSGERVAAIAYVACEDSVCEPSRPSRDYFEKIVTGAHHHKLPDAHIRMIEDLAS